MSARARLGGNLKALSYALTRVAAEMKDWQLEFVRDPAPYDVIVFVGPVTSAEATLLKGAVVRAALTRKQREGQETEAPKVEFSSGRRETLGFYCTALVPSADYAALTVLTIVREALHELGMTTKWLRIEVEPEGDKAVHWNRLVRLETSLERHAEALNAAERFILRQPVAREQSATLDQIRAARVSLP